MKRITALLCRTPSPRKNSPEYIKTAVKRVTKCLEGKKPSDLNILEKAVLRGEGKAIKEGKLNRKELKKHITSYHKTTGTGTQILRLPKQPFGSHLNYSCELDFTQDHFISPDQRSDPAKFKQLQEAARKSQMPNKRANLKLKVASASHKFRLGENQKVFRMKAGDLICNKEESIEKIYESQSNKYRKVTVPIAVTQYLQRKPTNVTERLFPKYRVTGSKFYENLMTKYEVLFAPEKPRSYSSCY